MSLLPPVVQENIRAQRGPWAMVWIAEACPFCRGHSTWDSSGAQILEAMSPALIQAWQTALANDVFLDAQQAASFVANRDGFRIFFKKPCSPFQGEVF